MAQYSPFSVSAKRQKKGPAQPIKSIWELLYHKGTSVSTLAEKLGETAHGHRKFQTNPKIAPINRRCVIGIVGHKLSLQVIRSPI